MAADTGLRQVCECFIHGGADELDSYIDSLLRTDPLFARAWYQRRAAEPPPLCINGHEYARRRKARRRRNRGH